MHQTHAALGASAQWWRHMMVTVEHLERTGVDIYLPRVSPFRFGLVMSRLNSLWWLRMTIPICFLQLVQNSWNLCGKIIPLFFQDLKVFAICPQGFALAYGKNLREWTEKGGVDIDLDRSAGGQWNMILQLILKWDTIFLLWKFHIFMKFRFVLSFSTKSYWRVPAIEHIEPGAMFFVRGHEFALGHVARPQRWIVWCASLSVLIPSSLTNKAIQKLIHSSCERVTAATFYYLKSTLHS